MKWFDWLCRSLQTILRWFDPSHRIGYRDLLQPSLVVWILEPRRVLDASLFGSLGSWAPMGLPENIVESETNPEPILYLDDWGAGSQTRQATLSAREGQTRLGLEGTEVFAMPTSDLISLRIVGGSSDDRLTIEFFDENPLPPGGLLFDGGPGGTNELALAGSAFVAEQHYVASGPDSGTIHLDGLEIVYWNLTPIEDLLPAEHLEFSATDGDDTIWFVDGPEIEDTRTSRIHSGDNGTFESLTFANKRHVTVQGLAGNDTFTLDNPHPAQGLESLTLTGGDGHDSIIVSQAFSVSDSLHFSATQIQLNAALSTHTGDLSLQATGQLTLGANIFSNEGNISLDGPTRTNTETVEVSTGVDGGNVLFHDALELATELSVSAGSGNVTFAGTVDSQPSEAHGLTISSGTGDVTFTGAVGSATDGVLGAVLINIANDVTFSSTLQTAGDVTQATGTGTTTFHGTSGTGIGGDLNVITNAIAVNSEVIVTAGTVNLHAQNAIDVNTGGGIDAGASTVTISANQDNTDDQGFTQAGGTTIRTMNATADAISISVGGTGGAAIAALQGDTTSGRVTITAGRAITDNNDAAMNITANAAVLTAVGGIGSDNALETTISSLAFHNIDSGNVRISNTGGLTVANVGSVPTSSNVGNTTLTATSPITFAADTTQADILAQAFESGTPNTDNITVNAGVTVTASTGNVEFEAGDRIIVHATAVVTARLGNVTFQSGFGDTDGDGSMTLNGTVNAPGAGGTITLNLNAQQGAVQSPDGALTATNLLLLSTGANGSFALASSANNDVTNLAASTYGTISFRDDNGVRVAAVETTGGITAVDAHVLIDSSNASGGPIVVSQPINTAGRGSGGTVSGAGEVTIDAALSTAGGSITLNGGTAATANLIINQPITSSGPIDFTALRDVIVDGRVESTRTGGTVTITARRHVQFGVAGDVTTNDGAIAVTADAAAENSGGAITMSDNGTDGTTVLASGIGTISLSADGNVTLGQLLTSGEVRVISTNGAIVDGGDTGGADITAATVALRAKRGIGTDANAIETAQSGGSLTLAAVTDSGSIHVVNTGAMIVGTVDGLSGVTITNADGAASGDDKISLVASSPLTIDEDVINEDGGNITLTAVDDGDDDGHLTINARVVATGGDGNIHFNAGTGLLISGAGTAPQVSAAGAGHIVGMADRNVILTGGINEVQVQTDTGNILLQAENGSIAADGEIASGTGHITLKAGDAIALNADVDVLTANPGTVSLDAGGGALSMHGSATVVAAGSSMRIAAEDDITLANVTARDISLVSRGGAVINAAGTAKNVTAANVRIQAEGSIGAAGRHVTSHLDNLTALSSSGSIFVTEDDGVTVTDVSVTVTEFHADASTMVVTDGAQSDLTTGANGHIVLVAMLGDIRLQDGVDGDGRAVFAQGSARVLLQSVAGSIRADADIGSGTGHITLKAGDAIALNADVDVLTANPGTVSLDAGGGALSMHGSTTVVAVDSSVRMAAQDDITLGNVRARNVSLVSRGGAVINAAGTTKNVTAANLRLQAEGSIGAAGRHVTSQIDKLTAFSSSGSIFVTEDDGVTVTDVSVTVTEFHADASTMVVTDGAQSDLTTGANGHIVLVAALGDIRLNDGTAPADGNAVVTSGGSILIQALGATSDVIINADVISGGGHIRLVAGDDVRLSADVTTGGGTVYIAAGNGTPQDGFDGIFFESGVTIDSSAVQVGTGDLRSNIEFDGPLTLGGKATMKAGAGNVTFRDIVSDKGKGSSIEIFSAADVTFLAAIEVDALRQTAGSGTTAFHGGSVRDSLAVEAHNIELRAGMLRVGEVTEFRLGGGSLVNHEGAALETDRLLLFGSGSFTLTDRDNRVIETLSAEVQGTVSFFQASSLTVGAIFTNGHHLTLGTGGDLKIMQNVSVGEPAQGTGNPATEPVIVFDYGNQIIVDRGVTIRTPTGVVGWLDKCLSATECIGGIEDTAAYLRVWPIPIALGSEFHVDSHGDGRIVVSIVDLSDLVDEENFHIWIDWFDMPSATGYQRSYPPLLNDDLGNRSGARESGVPRYDGRRATGDGSDHVMGFTYQHGDPERKPWEPIPVTVSIGYDPRVVPSGAEGEGPAGIIHGIQLLRNGQRVEFSRTIELNPIDRPWGADQPLPPDPEPMRPQVEPRPIFFPSDPAVLPTESQFAEGRLIVPPRVQAERQLQLVRVQPDGSETPTRVRYDERLLQDRARLLRTIEDDIHVEIGRYRLYLVEPDGSRQLLLPFRKDWEATGDLVLESEPESKRLPDSIDDDETPPADEDDAIPSREPNEQQVPSAGQRRVDLRS